MFDEYVEHASATPNGGIAHGASPLPQLQYQGFEPSPYEDEDAEYAEELDGQYADSGVASEPVFDLGRVQFDIPAPLVSLVASSDTVAMGFLNNAIVMLELSHDEDVHRVQIPRKPSDMALYKIFLDPSGRHLIITSSQGENWWLYKGWKKPKPLKGFKFVIESIAWNKPALLSNSRSTSTREFLIGASNGTIWEAVLDAEDDFFKSQERSLHQRFALPERRPITGLKFTLFPPQDPKKVLVIVTTPSRIYQFVGVPDRRGEGDGRLFVNLFNSYRDTAPKIQELPGNIVSSELQFYTPNSDQALSLPKTMAWLTAPGIYHGTMNFESTSDDLIDGTGLLPYPQLAASPSSPSHSPPASSDAPLSLILTEFHYILLYGDRVIGISSLDEKLVYEDLLPLKAGEEVRGLAADPVRKTYWVYTSLSLYELSAKNEDRDIWKVYLEQGSYDRALKYAKTAGQRDHILSAQAQAYFGEGRFFQAAQCYAQCSAPFEEVALKFLDAGERDSLRSYLVSRLERTRKTDLTQRMMLATWLLEFYLSGCNELDDLIASESVSHDVETLQTQRSILEEDLKNFFQTYKSNMDRKTVYELIQGHGRTDMYLYYASLLGDSVRVVAHWVMEEEWLKAIDVISRQSDLELYYRFGPVLLRQSPKETIDAWIRQPALDPIRLIPSLLGLQQAPRDPTEPNHSIRYLNHLIFEQGNMNPTIHNLIVTFYTSPADESDAPLLRFLTNAPKDPMSNKPYYDLDYALRLCRRTGRTQPCVHIYSQMGLYENSVDLALEKGDVELAKLNAQRATEELADEVIGKKLWLKVARYVVQDKKDVKSAMHFLESTGGLLKVEDVLPFFPDFVVIDDFKEEIARALEEYAAHIEALRAEMEEKARSAEAIKDDIAKLRERFVTIDAGEKCAVCGKLVMSAGRGQFYVFPCQHTFHAECLIGLAKEYLPQHTLRKLVLLQTELFKGAALEQKSAPGVPPSLSVSAQRTLLSANFAAPGRSLGRNILNAGDKLRDLIIPDALASVVSAPVAWMPGLGGSRGRGKEEEEKKAERAKKELEDVLSESCPLCESVIVGLDRGFVKEGEGEEGWEL